jgi:hypothetical protein
MDLSRFKNFSKLLPELEVIDKMYEYAKTDKDLDQIILAEKGLSGRMAYAFYKDTKNVNSKERVFEMLDGVEPSHIVNRLKKGII